MGKNERKICPVCRKYEFEIQDFYEICPICGWEDDPYQRECTDVDGGANDMSLNEARKAWAKGEKIR